VSEAGDQAKRRWRRLPRWLRLALAVLLLLLLVALAVAWVMRVELATHFIDRELARRGVTAHYQVKRIGFGSQIFENLVIGDPRRPDLTARHVEVDILFGFTGPRVGRITAQGVRMRGRIVDGRPRFGQIDRLLPAPSGEPFRLPDQDVDVRDAALTMATPAGEMVVALAGRGALSDGFRGTIVLLSPRLQLGGCTLERPTARLLVRVRDEKPRLRGPAALERLTCGNVEVTRPLLALKAVLMPGLDGWRGATALRIAAIAAGDQRLAALRGHMTFSGNAKETVGGLQIASGPTRLARLDAAAMRFDGRYSLLRRGAELGLDGHFGADAVHMPDTAGYARTLAGARGTPLGPIADALATAVLRAGRGGAALSGTLALVHRAGAGSLRLSALAISAASGARLAQGGGDGIVYAWPSGALQLGGVFALRGGGFPDADFAFVRGEDGRASGAGRIAPMAAGDARLVLGPIAFAAAPGGRTGFSTSVRLDGPIAGGRVTGLSLPLAGWFGRGGFAIGERCVAAVFESLQIQRLRLAAARLPLCPVGRALVRSGAHGTEIGAELRGLRLAGRLGSSPITIAADGVRVDRAAFTARGLAVRLRAASGVNRLDVATFAARFGPHGMTGPFAGLAGELANVPLLVSADQGSWTMRGTDLALAGRLIVADRNAPARFVPLAGEDFRLTLAGNRIHATGALVHPATATRVALATIEHDLGSGTGHAVLQVPELRFAEHGLQPDALTPLTTGVVALVDGAVSGEGRIDWDARATRSTGRFATAGMNLAAPFGPVQGLSTEIHFTDLLGLVSAPGQEARIRQIQPGIDVFDGIVRYQLRPDYHVAVEAARWPLAGGTLTLDPTILDFSQESIKYLTFRVEGLDAARFIQQLEFSNIAATGSYDGIIPMQFDRGGGRILGGHLVARGPGGTLSYVGELSDRDLGAYGVLAFDALKSLRYSRLEITLDGALDGEFLTRIAMDGLARNPGGTREPGGGISGMVVGRVLHQLARIPFHFNIRISGPFRALVATARSFEDPSDLIRASLPQLIEAQRARPPSVQHDESEPVR
jgi:translocation and assembly module TamB